MGRRKIAAAAALLLVTLSGTGCGSEARPTSSPAGPNPTPTASPSRDALADCASQIDYWITTQYLQGQPDRGDYQEMGLGSAEGLALRQLEQHLSQSIKTFPAPAPADLRREELASCDAAGASATATGTKPPVWP